MDSPKSFLRVANVAGLTGLGTAAVVALGLLVKKGDTTMVDWRDIAALAVSGSWLTSVFAWRPRN